MYICLLHGAARFNRPHDHLGYPVAEVGYIRRQLFACLASHARHDPVHAILPFGLPRHQRVHAEGRLRTAWRAGDLNHAPRQHTMGRPGFLGHPHVR